MNKFYTILALLIVTISIINFLAFTPIKPIMKVNGQQHITVPRNDSNVSTGDTLTLYLSDAAGNLVTAEAVVDSASADSIYVTRVCE